MAQMMRRDIGELLVQGRVINADQLAQAREISGRTGVDLAAVLVQQFNVSPFQVLQAQAFAHNMRAIDLTKNEPDPSAINLVPAHTAQRHKAVPVMKRRDAGTNTEVLVV